MRCDRCGAPSPRHLKWCDRWTRGSDLQQCKHIADYYQHLLNHSGEQDLRKRRRIQELAYDYSRGARDEAFARMFAKV